MLITVGGRAPAGIPERAIRKAGKRESPGDRRVWLKRVSRNATGCADAASGKGLVSYHALPKNSRRRKLWLAALGEKPPSNWDQSTDLLWALQG
ncbi:hypothetical protein MRX96_057980 [Rhipicephalus microplus]